jgi:hypothetical protein
MLRHILAAGAAATLALAAAAPAGAGQKGPTQGGASLTITGIPSVGQVLCVPAYAGATYQWLRDGAAIAGETDRCHSTVTADGGHVDTAQVTAAGVTVSASLAISGTPITTATQGSAYTSWTASASGGIGPYTYSIASGAYPSGITLNGSTGVSAGTPTVSGNFAGIVIRATDAISSTTDLPSFTLVVNGTGSCSTGQFDFSQACQSGHVALIH